MLVGEAYWDRRYIESRLKELHKDGYTVHLQDRTAEGPGMRIMLVHQLELENRFQGYNLDEIHFTYAPSDREKTTAIIRTTAKKGRVYIQGRKIYDHQQQDTQQTSEQEGEKQEEING